MYPPPIGVLPITGFDMVGMGALGAGLLIIGLIAVRAATFARYKRRS
jgi:hypothetical protein